MIYIADDDDGERKKSRSTEKKIFLIYAVIVTDNKYPTKNCKHTHYNYQTDFLVLAPIPRNYQTMREDPNDGYSLIGSCRFEVCNEILTFCWLLDPGKHHFGSLYYCKQKQRKQYRIRTKAQWINVS